VGEQRQQVRRRDDVELASPGGLAACAAGQISPLSLADACSAASSTPGETAIRRGGSGSPIAASAARTRSRLSATALSGRPT